MKILHSNLTTKHNTASSTEGAYRVDKFTETVSEADVLARLGKTQTDILAVHTVEYMNFLKTACTHEVELAEVDLTESSWNAMLASTTLAVMAAEGGDFAVSRPPGHHASENMASGFCFFNNVAIAAKAIAGKTRRVCIIDIDGHHGNGTQEIFRNDGNVLFCSLHQDQQWPNTGLVTESYMGPDRQNVIDLPLPAGSGNDVFKMACGFILTHMERFNPDIIALSAGFDGYIEDRLLDLQFTTGAYNWLGEQLRQRGKQTFAVLEGGYHRKVFECVSALVSGFNGEHYTTAELPTKSSAAVITEVQNTFSIAKSNL